MSTYWGYHCKDDDDYSEHQINHGEQELRDVAAVAEHFKAIVDSDAGNWVEMSLMAYGQDQILWLVRHAGHAIELHNEYGETEPL